nr:reverse transcriptase domain-containing protein [Tanacetum cinerariifolium]
MMFFEESDKVEKYVGGLPDMIHGSVVAPKPKTMQEAIEIATELMDKKVLTFAERETASKRKLENTSRTTWNQQQQQQHSNKRQNTGRDNQGGKNNAPARVYDVGRAGTDPDANVTVGHEAAYGMSWKMLMKMMTDKYCPRNEIRKLEMKLWELKVKGTNLASYTQRFQELALLCGRMFFEEDDKIEKYVGGQKLGCYECGVQGHFKRECPKLKNNNNQGNQGGRNNAPARVYAVGRAAQTQTLTS